MIDTHNRFFIVYQNSDLWTEYLAPEVSNVAFTEKLRTALGRQFGAGRFSKLGFSVVDRPSLRVGYPEGRALVRLRADPDHPMVIVISFDTPEDARSFEEGYKPSAFTSIGRPLPVSGLYADLPISAAEMPPFQHFCPGTATSSLSGDRAAAERLLRSDIFGSTAFSTIAKEQVSIVVVDQGIQHSRFPSASTANGWPVNSRMPFTATGRHGSMIARNATAFAPGATLFDCPLLPDRIDDLGRFLSLGVAAYINIILSIIVFRETEPRRSWVITNAWGIFDLRIDTPPGTLTNYSHNPNHYFTALVRLCSLLGIDIIFAAGNCGEFCPSTRCGPDDRGPGRSIHGANSAAEVLTVGAVRFDGVWLGYSSQGPGVPAMQKDKPDVCAPSQFGEVSDASLDGFNTGTSAACGVAAGVVAGLRRRWSTVEVTPEEIRRALRGTAWLPSSEPDSKLRFGHGIIDVEAAVKNFPMSGFARLRSLL